MPLRYAYAFLAVAFLAMAFYCFELKIIAGAFCLIGSIAAIDRCHDADTGREVNGKNQKYREE